MLKPYVAKQKEVGVKYDAGRVGGSLAFFSTDKPRAFLNSRNLFGTYGKDRHQGLELAVQGEATQGLRLLGGLTWRGDAQQQAGPAGHHRWQARDWRA